MTPRVRALSVAETGTKAPLTGHLVLGHRRDFKLTKLGNGVGTFKSQQPPRYPVGARCEHAQRRVAEVASALGYAPRLICRWLPCSLLTTAASAWKPRLASPQQ